MGTTRIGTSVAAPALLGGGPFNHPYYVAFAAGGGYGGAEPNRRINVLRGDNLERPTVMDEWSNDAIALSWDRAVHGTEITLAWTGNDPARRLNFAGSGNGVDFRKTSTLNHTCLGGPALAYHDGRLMFAWTGGGGLGAGPPDQRLNVMWGGGQHVILPHKSPAGPALAADPGIWPGEHKRLYLAWTNAEGHIYTSYCRLSDINELNSSAHIRRVETEGRPETTFTSPGLAFSGNALYLSWAGTDAARKVNFKILAGTGAGKKVTVPETASSAIAMTTYHHSWNGRYAYRGTDGVGGVYLTDTMPV